MDFRQLRSLVYVADCGSLSRAAEILRTSQPSLSQHIKHLEAELGVQLLHRHSRGVTLTELGHSFLRASANDNEGCRSREGRNPDPGP
jgi:DNA-binding transcriptional LysR family regulator